jgi:hypothetical protein
MMNKQVRRSVHVLRFAAGSKEALNDCWNFDDPLEYSKTTISHHQHYYNRFLLNFSQRT